MVQSCKSMARSRKDGITCAYCIIFVVSLVGNAVIAFSLQNENDEDTD